MNEYSLVWLWHLVGWIEESSGSDIWRLFPKLKIAMLLNQEKPKGKKPEELKERRGNCKKKKSLCNQQ